MPSAIRMSHILMQANAALVETLVKALREVGHAATVTSLPRFLGSPDSPCTCGELKDIILYIKYY